MNPIKPLYARQTLWLDVCHWLFILLVTLGLILGVIVCARLDLRLKAGHSQRGASLKSGAIWVAPAHCLPSEPLGIA